MVASGIAVALLSPITNGGTSLNKLAILISFVCIVAATTASWADYSINQKKIMKSEDKALGYDLKYMHKHCDSKMTAAIHWPSFESEVNKKVDGKLRTSISGYCTNVITSLWQLCKKDPEYRDTVRDKVKSFECRYVEGKKKRKMTFKKGKLTLYTPWDSLNLKDFTDKFVGGVL